MQPNRCHRLSRYCLQYIFDKSVCFEAFFFLFLLLASQKTSFSDSPFFHPTPVTITLPEHPTYHPPMLSTQQQHSHTRHVYWLWLSGLSEFKFALCQRSCGNNKPALKKNRRKRENIARLKTGLNDRQDARTRRTNGREINHPNVDHRRETRRLGDDAVKCSEMQLVLKNGAVYRIATHFTWWIVPWEWEDRFWR